MFVKMFHTPAKPTTFHTVSNKSCTDGPFRRKLMDTPEKATVPRSALVWHCKPHIALKQRRRRGPGADSLTSHDTLAGQSSSEEWHQDDGEEHMTWENKASKLHENVKVPRQFGQLRFQSKSTMCRCVNCPLLFAPRCSGWRGFGGGGKRGWACDTVSNSPFQTQVYQMRALCKHEAETIKDFILFSGICLLWAGDPLIQAKTKKKDAGGNMIMGVKRDPRGSTTWISDLHTSLLTCRPATGGVPERCLFLPDSAYTGGDGEPKFKIPSCRRWCSNAWLGSLQWFSWSVSQLGSQPHTDTQTHIHTEGKSH